MTEELKLRPHHIYCVRNTALSFPGRGEAFTRVEDMVRDILTSGGDFTLEVVEGPDMICRVCPEFRRDGCQSLAGDEVQVRKWDAIIIRGLGIAYGQNLTRSELNKLVSEKAPLKFCLTRCGYRTKCPEAVEREKNNTPPASNS